MGYDPSDQPFTLCPAESFCSCLLLVSDIVEIGWGAYALDLDHVARNRSTWTLLEL